MTPVVIKVTLSQFNFYVFYINFFFNDFIDRQKSNKSKLHSNKVDDFIEFKFLDIDTIRLKINQIKNGILKYGIGNDVSLFTYIHVRRK